MQKQLAHSRMTNGLVPKARIFQETEEEDWGGHGKNGHCLPRRTPSPKMAAEGCHMEETRGQ